MREVVNSRYFDDQLASISADIQRLDDVLSGVVWSISRTPEVWPVVEGTHLRAAITERAGDIPRLVIYFSIDDENTCTLRGILMSDDPEEDW